jgi:glycosylphosphatidylinositol transamidase
MTEFSKLGISASTQGYTFTANTGVPSFHFGAAPALISCSQIIKGMNAYGILSSPRSSGTEAMVISASWLSLIEGGEGTLNLRGVATVLALAGFLKRWFT